MRLPKRMVPVLVAGIVAGFMTFVVSGISTWRSGEGMELWMESWGISWMIAFPLLYVLRPRVVRFVERLARE